MHGCSASNQVLFFLALFLPKIAQDASAYVLPASFHCVRTLDTQHGASFTDPERGNVHQPRAGRTPRYWENSVEQYELGQRCASPDVYECLLFLTSNHQQHRIWCPVSPQRFVKFFRCLVWVFRIHTHLHVIWSYLEQIHKDKRRSGCIL